MSVINIYGYLSFNPRTPGGVRQQLFNGVSITKSFNPRTPGGVRPQSIDCCEMVSGFNPRTPGGVRRPIYFTEKPVTSFNPRTPGGVRLTLSRFFIFSPMFQSTHPGRGATSPRRSGLTCVFLFQSTHPGRGATPFLITQFLH